MMGVLTTFFLYSKKGGAGPKWGGFLAAKTRRMMLRRAENSYTNNDERE